MTLPNERPGAGDAEPWKLRSACAPISFPDSNNHYPVQGAAEIAAALGGRPVTGGRYQCSCPVPSHGKGKGDKRPSLLIRDGDRRLLVKCWAGCRAHDVLDELRRRGLLDGRQTCRSAASTPPKPTRQRDLRSYAETLWRESRPIGDAVAATYFRQQRGITIPLPPTLRFHTGKRAVIAAVSGEERRLLSVQATFLSTRGLKLSRRTFGRVEDGAARLGAADKALGLAEGVETALSVTELFGVTCWATLGAERFTKVAIPACVEELHIYADRDTTGLAKAEEAARSFSRRLRVEVHAPGRGDFNDVLRARREAA